MQLLHAKLTEKGERWHMHATTERSKHMWTDRHARTHTLSSRLQRTLAGLGARCISKGDAFIVPSFLAFDFSFFGKPGICTFGARGDVVILPRPRWQRNWLLGGVLVCQHWLWVNGSGRRGGFRRGGKKKELLLWPRCGEFHQGVTQVIFRKFLFDKCPNRSHVDARA